MRPENEIRNNAMKRGEKKEKQKRSEYMYSTHRKGKLTI